ncbi:hypothetical protein GcM1_167020, partial [Golovinomyces cichoracearum]
DRSPSPKPVNLKFLDQDDPGPSEQLGSITLPYEESSLASSPVHDAICTMKKNSDQRITEAKALFGSIAKILDQHCTPSPEMPIN